MAPPRKTNPKRKVAWTRPGAKESDNQEAGQETSWLSKSFSRMLSARMPDSVSTQPGSDNHSSGDRDLSEAAPGDSDDKNKDGDILKNNPMTSLKGIHFIKLKHSLSEEDMEVTEV